MYPTSNTHESVPCSQTNTYYTSVLWVLWYAPQQEPLKNSSVADFCFKRYLIGARYYDGDLGLWTSVDAARQFWSPYGYVGNGWNPVNGVDEDGNVFEGEMLLVYENARANHFWGSKTLQENLENRHASSTKYNGIIRSDMRARGLSLSKNGMTIINLNSSLSEFELASTLMHESIEGITSSSDLAHWHKAARLDQPIPGKNFEELLELNASGQLGKVDKVYLEEYKAYEESKIYRATQAISEKITSTKAE
jgi:RHS repeat-associated protein